MDCSISNKSKTIEFSKYLKKSSNLIISSIKYYQINHFIKNVTMIFIFYDACPIYYLFIIFGSELPGYVNPEIKLKIITEYTEIHDFGWVFYYNTVKAIETGDFRDGLAGIAPLIIDKHSGELIETGTAHQTS